MATKWLEPRVWRRDWKHRNGGREPALRIQVGERWLSIPLQCARGVVDRVHDICDAWEAEQR